MVVGGNRPISFLFVIEEAVENGGLLFAQFLFHGEEGIVVLVFGVLAVLIFGGSIFVDLIVDEVVGRGRLLLAVEGVPKRL